MRYVVKMFAATLLMAVMCVSPCAASQFQSNNDQDVPNIIMVDGGYLQLQDSIYSSSSRNGVRRYIYHVVTNGGNLNVRSGPGTNYYIVGQFANGQAIDVSFWQESGIEPWVYATGVDCNTGSYIGGYIHGDYYQ